MSDIEKSQIAFMDECARNGCNHQCNEGRDCPNQSMSWLDVMIYISAAAFTVSMVAGTVAFLRWLWTQ